MTPAVGWIPLSVAARAMEMTRFGARKRLQRLQAASGENILRMVGARWEVSSEALNRSLAEPERQLDALGERLHTVEQRLDSLRRVGSKFRKETRLKSDRLENQIAATFRAVQALAEAAQLFESPRKRQRTATNGNESAVIK